MSELDVLNLLEKLIITFSSHSRVFGINLFLIWVLIKFFEFIWECCRGRASLPLSGSRAPSHLWPPPSSFRICSYREGKFFIGVMKLSSTPTQNSVELDPGRPEIPQQASKPSPPHLPRPLANGWRRPGNITYGGASPGDPVPSITSPGRMVEWPSSTVSPSSHSAQTSRSRKAR